LILPQNDAGILYFTATGTAIFYDYIQAGAVSPLTTKGDVYTFSTSDARLGVGANATVLTADSAEATGLKWAAPGGALALSTIASGSLTSGTTLTLSSLSSYDYLILVLNGITWGTGSSRITVLVNNDNTGVYIQAGTAQVNSTIYTTRNLTTTSINTGFGLAQGNTEAGNTYIVTFTNCKSTGFTNANVDGVFANASAADASSAGQYVYKVAAAVSSLVVGTLNGYTFNGSGTYQLLGA
jgi:hypothetical protein